MDEKEAGLLSLLQAGDKEAFAELYTLYSARLYQNLIKLVKSREEAEEILQDIFITLWEKRRSIEIHSSFKSYLFRIGENKVHDFFRKAKRDKSLYTLLRTASTEEYSHIEENLLAKENKHLLQQAIAQLPPQRRLVFERCKVQGRSYQEVSEELGISTSTINDHIVKATRSIREYVYSNHKVLVPLILTTLMEGI